MARKRRTLFTALAIIIVVVAMAYVARTQFGLFTTAGRVVTAANRVRGRAANRALVGAIAEPGNLRQLMELTMTSKKNPAYVAFLTQMGALAMLTPEEFPEAEFAVEGP